MHPPLQIPCPAFVFRSDKDKKRYPVASLYKVKYIFFTSGVLVMVLKLGVCV